MKRTHLAVAALATGFLLLGLATVGAANLVAKPTPTAVVEVERVFNALKQKAEFDAQQKAKQEALRATAQEKQKAIETMSSDLDMLTPGSPAYEAKQTDLKRAALEIQLWGRFEEQEMGSSAALELETLYRNTLAAVERIAQESGYELVLFKDGLPNFRYENLQQLAALIQSRRVLYAADTVDITDDVIRRMNNDFDNSR